MTKIFLEPIMRYNIYMTINKTEQNLDKKFGDYGGSFVPETLIPALKELEESFKKFIKDE